MKKLTENQKTLLPVVRDNAPATKKGEILKRLINGYLGGENLSKDDLDIIKIAVQLYQTKERQKKLHAKQRQQDYKERKAENKILTREKIIFGACDYWAIKNQKSLPFLSVLMAWRDGFLSDRDREFLATRYQMKKGVFTTGYNFWRVDTDKYQYMIREQYSEKRQVYCIAFVITNTATNTAERSIIITDLDHDPRTPT